MAEESEKIRKERFIGESGDFTFYSDGSAPPVSKDLKKDLAKWTKDLQGVK